MPEVGDVVTGTDGLRGIVRAVHPSGFARVASHGDHDEGVWVELDHLTVVYRESAAQVEHVRDVHRPRAGKVTTLVVDRAVWKQALKLAGGDCKRITIVSATEVRIR